MLKDGLEDYFDDIMDTYYGGKIGPDYIYRLVVVGEAEDKPE